MSVTPELWARVIERDAWAVFEEMPMTAMIFERWWAFEHRICVVPLLDPGNPYPCGGKQEVDHVKDDLRMGKRAPDDEYHLVAACQNHNTWHPPRKELRRAEREYLAGVRAAASA